MNKLSHTSLNYFQDCPMKYKHRYINNIVSKYKTGALYFGDAIDKAVNVLLEGKTIEEAHSAFQSRWMVSEDNQHVAVSLPENENIVYAAADFDGGLLSKSDYAELFKFLRDHNLPEDPFGVMDGVKKQKAKDGWDSVNVRERKFYNFANWLSLEKKGHLMIDAYVEQILPRIKKVLLIQPHVELSNEEGDIVHGYTDFVCLWEDDSIVVLDNKTSSRDYEEDAVLKSQQLALYTIILNNWAEDKVNGWDKFIDKAGYIVINKAIEKDTIKTCTSCGAICDSSHKKCNVEINGKRCNGEFDKVTTFKVNIQVLIDKISDHVQDMVLENINDINVSIKNNSFPRNFNACKTQYGFCDYYKLCWYKNDKDVIYVKRD